MLKNTKDSHGNKLGLQKSQAGFTIIELMIATTVFSVTLLIVSAGMIAIGKMYYKNITSGRTQEAARSVVEDISSSIQFSSGQIIPPADPIVERVPNAFCVGTDKYTFVVNQQVKNGNFAMWRDRVPEGSPCTPNFPPSAASQQILSENMRLLGLNIDPASGRLVNVGVRVAYGDDDLLDLSASPVQCKGGIAGSSFCSISALDTTMERRIN